MRRLGAVLIVLPLIGCGALRDAFSAHPADAARVGGQSLTPDQLGSWASVVKGMPLQPANLQRLAGMWVDYTLFATTVAGGQGLDDSATIAAAMWPMISQAKWDHFRERLVSGHTNLTPAQVDSAYKAGQVRAFQHILLQVGANATPTVMNATKAKMQGILQQLQAAHGSNFATLARKYSEDGSKVSGGYLGVWPKGHFVGPFDYAAWQLGPGEMSGVVESPFGFHIIRRPPLSEIRDSFALGVQSGIDQTFDSIYITHLRAVRHLKVESGAPKAARGALQDADIARNDGTTLVSYDGGAFRVKDLFRWVEALDPQAASSIPGAPDAQLNRVLETLATRDILLQQADSAKVTLTPGEWGDIKTVYDSTLATLEGMIELTPATLKDSGGAAAREALAATHVNDYLEAVVNRRKQFMPVPPFLAAALRAKGDWSVSAAGVQRASEQAQADRDAMGGGPSGPGTGGQPLMKPAPGPAPTPGGTPPAGATPSRPQGGR